MHHKYVQYSVVLMIKGGIFREERNLMMLGKDGYGFDRSTFSEVFMKPEVKFIILDYT